MDKISLSRQRCPANHPCPIVKVCPAGAVVQKGFDAPMVDEKKCTGCGKCVKYCGYGVFHG